MRNWTGRCSVCQGPARNVTTYGLVFCAELECRRARNRHKMQIYTAKKKAAGVDIFAPYRAKAYAKKRARIAAGEIPASVWTEARANAALKRKALKLGATTEDFTRLEVFERDGWTCGLCGEPVDRELKWPDPMSPSLDHVIPLIKGGDHSRANTQCSHLTCNVRKHDRILT